MLKLASVSPLKRRASPPQTVSAPITHASRNDTFFTGGRARVECQVESTGFKGYAIARATLLSAVALTLPSRIRNQSGGLSPERRRADLPHAREEQAGDDASHPTASHKRGRSPGGLLQIVGHATTVFPTPP